MATFFGDPSCAFHCLSRYLACKQPWNFFGFYQMKSQVIFPPQLLFEIGSEGKINKPSSIRDLNELIQHICKWSNTVFEMLNMTNALQQCQCFEYDTRDSKQFILAFSALRRGSNNNNPFS